METSFLASIHTKVVHFPIALLTTYSVLEIFGLIFNKEFLSKCALLILCLGVITSVFAALTGNQASAEFNFWNDASRNLLNEHQTYATYLLWFSVIVCILRIYFTIRKKLKGIPEYLFILFAAIIIFLVYQTGIRGGDLVKKFGVGTDLSETLNQK